jgi:PAS domain S-box-containing protein
MQSAAEIPRFLFDHARDIILVIDGTSGSIVDANRAAEQAYLYSRDQLIGMTIFDLRPGSATVVDQMHHATAHGILFETLHCRSDGTSFPVEVSSRGETVSGRQCLFSIIRDITERKRSEAERDELLATTQRALDLRDEFLMIASHELRTPVTNVSLQLQQLARLIDRGATRTHLRIIGEAALRESARLTSLIGALLDAQVAKGQVVLELADVDLADVVAEVVERYRVRAEQSGSSLAVEVPSLRGRWDRLRLDQVITNLLLNAIKYGCGRPIRLDAARDGAEARLAVIDQGLGVAQEDTHRIFDKFERAVPPQYGGLGLGLFIARQIVEAHHGRLEIESSPGIGSTFRVNLPLAG